MRIATLLTAASLSCAAIAQRPTGPSPNLEVTNFIGAVALNSDCPATGVAYPVPEATPPGYTATGVAPGTRAWTYTPVERVRQGQQRDRYLTVRGLTQDVQVGACQTAFPGTNDASFTVGLAPVQATGAPHGFEHAAGGADLVNLPSMSAAFTGPGGFRMSVSLTTPIVLDDPAELCLFAEYRGGEQRDSTTLGQTISVDWRGGTLPFRGGVYYGFTVGDPGNRNVTLTTRPSHRAQIGLIVDEPQLTATGYHGNVYAGNPLPNEDYLGLAGHEADWTTVTTANSTLFFNLSAGSAYANGQAVVFFNWSPQPVASTFPTPFGNVLLNVTDPVLNLFAGTPLQLDGNGDYRAGPTNPLRMPQLGPRSRGYSLTFQAIVVDSGFVSFDLTNASAVVTY